MRHSKRRLTHFALAVLKSGRLAEPYKGIADCAAKTYNSEGLAACELSTSVTN